MSQYYRGMDEPVRLRRVDRWLAKRGNGLPQLTNDGALLLDRRLRIRRRAVAVAVAVSAPAVAAFVLCIRSSNLDRPGAGNRVALAWLALALSLAAVAVLTWAVLVRVGERRLATTLTRRVSRDTAQPIWRQLGALRTANCLFVGIAGLVMLAALIAAHAGALLIATFAGLLVVNAALSGVALWELARAPALAVDKGSLAADERLRRLNVHDAIYPVVALLSAVPSFIALIDGLDHGLPKGALLCLGLTGLVQVTETLARWLDERDGYRTLRRRWESAA